MHRPCARAVSPVTAAMAAHSRLAAANPPLLLLHRIVTTRGIPPRRPQERGFLYVHTPIITAADCEGAGEMFSVTTLLPADPKKEVRRRRRSGGPLVVL